ncbi:MAG: YraN family protein [Tannerellaceae bacterium]|jgi:putative endonuclease|nr:YraN family protein [Tannerellaceae bacterium]
MARQNITGREGEDNARKYLIDRGYTIVHSNWRWRRYEIDIIASKGDELVVVEVKTRSGNCLRAPEDAVDSAKIRRTVAAADSYVRSSELDMPVRFDIITLVKYGGRYETEHIKDAFYAPMQQCC